MVDVSGCRVRPRGNKHRQDLSLVIGNKACHQGSRSKQVYDHHLLEKRLVLAKKLAHRLPGNFISGDPDQVFLFQPVIQESADAGLNDQTNEKEDQENGNDRQYIQPDGIEPGICLNDQINYRSQVTFNQVDNPPEKYNNH